MSVSISVSAVPFVRLLLRQFNKCTSIWLCYSNIRFNLCLFKKFSSYFCMCLIFSSYFLLRSKFHCYYYENLLTLWRRRMGEDPNRFLPRPSNKIRFSLPFSLTTIKKNAKTTNLKMDFFIPQGAESWGSGRVDKKYLKMVL